MVSDQEIARGVETLLRQSDPNAVNSLNGVVQQLGAKLGLDLSHKAGFIRDQINLLRHYSHHHHQQLPPAPLQAPPLDHFALRSHHHNQHHYPSPQLLNINHQQFPSHFALNHIPGYRNPFLPVSSPPQQLQPQVLPVQLQQPAPPRTNAQPHPPKSATASAGGKASKESGPKRRGGAGGLNKVCGISPELQVVLGVEALSRTEIVKQLWVYIRKHGLQDPSNKRKIICDEALRAVFNIDCTDMFQMNKLLSKHIHPLEPSKSGSSKRVKVEVENSTETTTESVPPTSPVIISDELAMLLGSSRKEMLPSEANQGVLEYIKANHLEDPNSMMIMCDPKLKELFGCESIHVMGVADILAHRHFFKSS